MVWLARFFLYGLPSLALLFPSAEFWPTKLLKLLCVIVWLAYAKWLERANGIGFGYKERRGELFSGCVGVVSMTLMFWMPEQFAQPKPISVLISKLLFVGAFVIAISVLAPGRSMRRIRLKFWQRQLSETT